MRKEKDMHNQNYVEALEKVTEFRVLFQKAQEKKIKEVETELVSEKAVISMAEGLLRKKNDEIRMSECALKKQSAELETLKVKVAELEAVNSIMFI